MDIKKESMLARMKRWREHSMIAESYNISARRVWGKPYKSHRTPTYKEYYIEIGDTPYGKKGAWRTELEIGFFEEGQMTKLEAELRLSNPEVFDDIIMRKIGYA